MLYLDISSAKKELIDKWNSAGICQGDTVLIHSNIRRTLISYRKKGVKLTVEDILDTLIKAVGDNGTLLFPLFNFSFPKDKFFDFKSTPSQMGALTEAARLNTHSIRTGHPIYSFAVIGKNSSLFKSIDNKSGYGSDSPFALLMDLDGKIASLDLEDQNSMTFYHHVEEMEQVDYRYFKDFSGIYVNNNGIESYRTYQLFVRNLERNVLTHVNPAGEKLWENGLYIGEKPKVGHGMRTVRARDMYTFTKGLIDSGNAFGNLYIFGGEEQ
ncbi:hypothetical protein A143_09435 [Vibrio splendidus ZS-139]|nr:hypothetical protein A143_09435 [Vibrio splendidus ZS-139]